VFSTIVIKGGRELTEDTQQVKGTTTYYYLKDIDIVRQIGIIYKHEFNFCEPL
jgi:hypothetical protein